ncbi:MAG TPA: DNA ligase D [Burkholderiaceae bacterium]
MSLEKYYGKRDFKITPEPRGKVKRRTDAAEPLAFFIQEHHATRLHYDFRLELNGTLKSWAVPKGPSLDPADKRLAVHVEDHPLDYGTFEGVIPPKQYGAGRVILWEKGTWIPDGDAEAGYRKGHLKFELQGHKLAGRWALVRMGKPSADGEKENWLLIKERDAEARDGEEADIVHLRPESVAGLDADGKPTGKTRKTDDAELKTKKTATGKAGKKAAAMAETSQAEAAGKAQTASAKRASSAGGAAAKAKTGAAAKAKAGADTDAKTGAAAKEKMRAAAKTTTGSSVKAGAGTAAQKANASAKAGAVAETRSAAAQSARKAAAAQLQPPATGVKAKLPDFISPQLATLVDKAPDGGEWLVEIKFDGYRGVTRIEKGSAQMYTRAGNDWSAKWPALTAACAALPVQSAWLDGEVVALNDDGSVSFSDLQNMARKGMQARLAYYVFDLMYLNGVDLRGAPLADRKRLLQALLAQAPEGGPLLYSDHMEGEAREAYAHACLHGIEGIVVKRADAPYLEARSKSWLKVKCSHRQEFVIGGYSEPSGARQEFGALLLGVYDDQGALHYAGRVGTGFNDETLAAVAAKMRKLERASSPFAAKLSGADSRGVHWLKPELVGEVQFAEWTSTNAIRHASFLGLRFDKKAADVRRERARAVGPVEKAAEQEVHATEAKADKKARPAAKGSAQGKGAASEAPSGKTGAGNKAVAGAAPSGKAASLAGVAISNPSRVLFAETGLTKFGLAQYYYDIADWILPHLRQRPLTLVRCPHGGGAQCFYQKHALDATSDAIARVTVPSKSGPTEYMMVESREALVAMVQMGVLELHTWGSLAKQLDKPDRIIFDLDPDTALQWEHVIEAAQIVRALLNEIGLQSFVKTTGGKGLHVVAPIKPEHDWDTIKDFTQKIARHLETLAPDRFTANMSKAKRAGRIFIDYLRNAGEATAVAAYSTRARPGAPVSVPLAWDELSVDLPSNAYAVANVRERLASLKQDPWADYYTLKQRVTAKMLKTFT